MPLAERVIEPSNLGGHPLNLRESGDGEVHITLSTNCLVGALYQLASIVRQADDIFCDISDECRKVLERTENINKKIVHIQHHVDNLDAKTVKIPIGDLSAYSRADDHHTAKHGFEINLFTEDSRPHCISDRYNAANQTPACKLRGADLYRKDGLCTERLFRMWPIVLNEHKVRTPDLNLPRKMQSVFTFEKRYKRLKTRPKTITSLDELYKDEEKKDQEKEKPYDVPRFPPSEKVSINISGHSFEKMESFRQALLHIEREDAKKKKKRKSISGVPEDIMKEIEKFERKRKSTSGHDVQDYLFDDLDDTVDQVDRDENMAKYFDEIDAKIEDRIEEEVLMKERKIMKFLPCRRSKSLPRCVRLYKPNEKRQSVVSNINAQGSSLSLASNGTCASRISRSTKRSSIISNKIKILVNGNNAKSSNSDKPRPRPKSLDLDAIDFNDDMVRSNLAHTKMPSMPDGVFNNTTAEMRRNIGPGSYYCYESNTLPRRQSRRSESPWEYLPKDWTSSVKLREINKGRSKEDRQSSSGHWSGTNSNRHSLDSDNVKSDIIPHQTSQISLGQDSGRGSPLPQDDRGSTDTNEGYIGDGGSTITDGTSIQEGKLDTDLWLRSLAIRAAHRDEISTSSAETLNSLTKLTKQNIEALDLMMSPSRRKPRTFEDEECSEYSVDQEGFYTSFHNDSGLRKSSATLVDEDELSHSKDSHSVCSFDSVIPNPDLDKHAGIKKNANCKSLNKVTPPKPPKRTSSMSSVNSKSQSTDISPGGISRQDSMFSDTDQETFFQRVEDKTKISAHGIPSLCTLTSDDDSILGKGDDTSPSMDIYNKDSFKIVDMNQNFPNPGPSNSSSFSEISEGKSFQDGSSMDGISVFTIDSDHSTFNFSKPEIHDCRTLPRQCMSKNDSSEYTKSWPRCNKKDETKSTLSSILKNSNNSLQPQKSLYVSPTLNIFSSNIQQGTEQQLPTEETKSASKEELEKMGDNSSYMLSIPMADGCEKTKSNDLPIKYQPVLVVKPGFGKIDSSASNTPSGKQLTETNAAKESSFAITGNPKVNLKDSMSESSTFFSSFSGSINSINSDLSMADSLTYVSRTSNCSSPNLSHMDIPAVLTPTGSMDSLMDTTNKCSDNSNLSTTMETVAITTNTSSFNSTTDDIQIPFKTFSGEMISAPFFTSTPYTSSAGMPQSASHLEESPVSYKHSEYQQKRMHSSQSFPSDMKNAIQNDNVSSKRHSIGNKSHPVVNLNHLEDSDHSNNAAVSSRTDSYRVAMVNPTRSGSYRVAMNENSNYPSFNNMSRRSTTPRVNVTNQMISQSKDQQPAQRSNNQQTLSHSQSYQGHPTTGGQSKDQSLLHRPSDLQSLSHSHSYQGYPTVGCQSKEQPSSQYSNHQQTLSHSQSYQGYPGGSGKGRYNPLYASSTDAVKISPPSSSHSSKQSQNKDQRNKQLSQSSLQQTKQPSPSAGHRKIQPVNMEKKQAVSLHSQGKYQKQPVKAEQQSQKTNYVNKASSRLNQSDPVPQDRISVKTNVRENHSTSALNTNEQCRTDSYRVALGTSYENPARNTSYRVAVKDTDPLIHDNRLDVIESVMTGGRDLRRMGITNIDQVKHTKSDIPTESQKQQVVRRRKPDVDPISVLSNRESNSGKTNKNRFSTSSTFIQFDPISEDWEFMMNSSDTLSNASDRDLMDHGNSFSMDTTKINAISGTKMTQEKNSSSSLLGSIKSTLKSMSGKQSKDFQDDGRFSMV
ncbi:uncharacterized protein LOC127724642 [Mytilus californianus]|uniref:uncharacterized protein LOC127724642 n=1 Tax=Mytilus californianus TaxID=6549 RepID=UPI0022467454|nr:uncharacterized protein LOC127724642 [Mytilus californianus]